MRCRRAGWMEAATPAMKRFVNAVRNLPDWPSFWPRYYALKREGGRARELEIGLRRGLVAHVPGALMSAFDEVFLREVYGNALRPPLGPAPVVIDIGANAGFFSLQVFARHPDARVIAFEPLPAHVALLRRQLERNPGLDLTIDPRAVCASAGTVEIRFDPRDEFSVAASTSRAGTQAAHSPSRPPRWPTSTPLIGSRAVLCSSWIAKARSSRSSTTAPPTSSRRPTGSSSKSTTGSTATGPSGISSAC